MNPLRLLASLTLFALCAFLGMVHGAAPAITALFLGSAALITQVPGAPIGSLFTVTLTPTILLQQTIRALFVKVPALMFFASEFTSERLKKDQQVLGKIRLRPTTSTYDATTGYKNGAQESRDLLVDVPFVMDQHIHITLKLDHLYALSDSMQKLEEHIQDSASVIGKAVVNYVLGKATSRAFSYGSTYSTANSNKDALNAIRKSMNARGVPDARFGIINSDVAETLAGDSRITNRYDGNSQTTDGDALLHLRNVSGFKDIIEYPDLADNTLDTAVLTIAGEADTEVITTSAAHGFAVNTRVQIEGIAGGTGITNGYFYVKTAPSTTTLTLSATRGGATSAFSTDITDGTIKEADNITGFFGSREAVAIKTGLPTDSLDVARSMGIPVSAKAEVVTDPDSGLSMLAYMWFEQNTMDAYVTLTMLYGATAGALVDTGSYAMEPAGHILRTA